MNELRKAVDEYEAAALGKDDQALLNAAEKLHSRYEALVRTIRPVLKEVDDFHQALYVVYHKYLPEKTYDSIRAASADLVAKAEAVTRTGLPQRLASKKDDFKKVFTPFFTTKTSSRKGTGLGLYVIRAIITETHKGKIDFQSEYQSGTCFTMEIPLAT